MTVYAKLISLICPKCGEANTVIRTHEEDTFLNVNEKNEKPEAKCSSCSYTFQIKDFQQINSNSEN